jgi:site-specific DNA recombinase
VYGYRRENTGECVVRKGRPVPVFVWVVDEAAAEVVRTAYRWYAEGRTGGWIVRELQRRGVPAPGGGRWHRTALRRILENPIYVGRRVWGKTSKGRFYRQKNGEVVPSTGGRKVEQNPPEAWFTTDDTPAIVDPALFEAVQARLARRQAPTPRLDAEAFLLSGLLVCGRCGGSMCGSSVRPASARQTGSFYVCRNYTHSGRGSCVRNEVKEDWAVRQVIAELRDRLLLPDRLEWLRDQLEQRAKEQRSEGSLAGMRKAAAALEAKLARCRSRLVDVSKDMVPEVEAQIRATRERLESARKELDAAQTADPVKELKVTVDAARAALYRLETALEGDDRCLLKEALRGILSGVVIGAEPYQTTTGKTRHRARIDGIRLRPGSGLDTLSMLSPLRTGT